MTDPVFEIHFDPRGEVYIENFFHLVKYFKTYANRAAASALSSEGFRLKNKLRQAIRDGGPEGHKWAVLNPHTGILSKSAGFGGFKTAVKNFRKVWKGQKGSKKRVNEYWQNKQSTRQKPFLKLAQGIRYELDQDQMGVVIGFVNANANFISIMKKHAAGYDTRVSPRMRKMAFALGFPLKKNTSVLKTPARPLIKPVFEEQKAATMENLDKKFFANIRRYMREDGKGLF